MDVVGRDPQCLFAVFPESSAVIDGERYVRFTLVIFICYNYGKQSVIDFLGYRNVFVYVGGPCGDLLGGDLLTAFVCKLFVCIDIDIYCIEFVFYICHGKC